MRKCHALFLLFPLAALPLVATMLDTPRSTPPPALLVANQGDRTLSIIDPATGKQVAAVPVGGVTGHEVVASPDGRIAFVPIYGNSGVAKPGTDGTTMAVIDIPSRKVTGTVDFGHGVRPHCAVYDPVSKLLYITTELDQAIAIIDPQSLKIVGSLPTGRAYSHMFAISHDGRRGYTSNVKPGSVSVIDMAARKVVTVIPISAESQRISVSRDDSMAFTSDQTTPRLAVIDTASNALKSWVDLPGTGYGTSSTLDGKWLLVAIPDRNLVAVVDLKTLKVTRTINVPAAPQEILMRPDGKEAYVSCNVKNQVAVIDLGDWKVTALIDAGKTADGLAWAR
jgi:YVTN family beta-propeller protein